MKEVTVTIRVRMTDKSYEDNFSKSVADIKSGKFQREMKSESDGITKVTATAQVIKVK